MYGSKLYAFKRRWGKGCDSRLVVTDAGHVMLLTKAIKPMRIFYAVPAIATPAPQSALWQANLYMSLRDLGHDVVMFEFDYSGISTNLDITCPAQAEYIRQHKPVLSEELLLQVRLAHAAKPI